VKVVKVNTINLHPRFKMVRGRTAKSSGYKKAIVTLKKGQLIDITTGI
jgi:large subunit ribosomal protein L23